MDTTVGAAGGADLSLAFERRGQRPLRSFSMPFSVSLSRSRSLSFLPNESSAAADVGGAGAASILLILTAPSATTPTRTMGSSGSARATTRCTKVRCGAFARGGVLPRRRERQGREGGEEVETASGGRSRDEGEMRGGYRGSMSTAGASIVQSGDGRSAYRRSRPTAQGDVESDGGGGERGEGEGGEAEVAPVSEGEVRRLSGEGVGVLARFDADREPPRIHGFEFTMVMGGTDRYRARREGVDGCREPVRCGEAKDKQKAARAAAKPKPSRSPDGSEAIKSQAEPAIAEPRQHYLGLWNLQAAYRTGDHAHRGLHSDPGTLGQKLTECWSFFYADRPRLCSRAYLHPPKRLSWQKFDVACQKFDASGYGRRDSAKIVASHACP
ncbi:hypothetical protein B0H10DRAFT_1956032 [Mycena sp. CBHHK59/15]|nr:hypothetical protein B0H10DRAFT_1956032 [Mycena sp. CBHHK59/15]